MPTGIRRTKTGWRAYVRVKGRLYSKRFPRDAAITVMKDWRDRKKVAAKTAAKITAFRLKAEPTIDVDAETYLQAVSSMPSIKDRRLHIQEWAEHFSGRTRQGITPLDVRTRLERLLSAGYSPATVNRRRTALMAFYSRLNGRSGYNPVRDVEKYPEDETPRAQSFWTVYRVLALMPPSKTRVRLRVLLWTGWPHMQIAKIQPEHLALARSLAYVTPRRKGKGRRGVWLPLLPGAVIALHDFHLWDCYGPFSRSSMRQAFGRAIAKLNARRKRFHHPPLSLRPYDLRHSFGTMLAERLQDDRAIQELMLHSKAEQTRRYTEAATHGRVLAAVTALSAGKLPRKLPLAQNQSKP